MAVGETSRHAPIDATAYVVGTNACPPEVGNRISLGVDCLIVIIDGEAAVDSCKAKLVSNAVERSGFDGLELRAFYAEIVIYAFCRKLVIALD